MTLRIVECRLQVAFGESDHNEIGDVASLFRGMHVRIVAHSDGGSPRIGTRQDSSPWIGIRCHTALLLDVRSSDYRTRSVASAGADLTKSLVAGSSRLCSMGDRRRSSLSSHTVYHTPVG